MSQPRAILEPVQASAPSRAADEGPRLAVDDREASLAAAFSMYYAPLVAFARKRLRDRDDAEDVVARVFSRLIVNQPDWRARTSTRPYLFGAVAHEVRAWGRGVAVRRRAAADIQVGDVGRAPIPRLVLTDERANAGELAERLARTIAALSDRQRLTLLLSRVEGWSYKQIAAHLGVTVDTVKTHLGRALAVLDAALTDPTP